MEVDAKQRDKNENCVVLYLKRLQLIKFAASIYCIHNCVIFTIYGHDNTPNMSNFSVVYMPINSKKKECEEIFFLPWF